MHLPLIYRALALSLTTTSPSPSQLKGQDQDQDTSTYSLVPETDASFLIVQSGDCLDTTATLSIPEEAEANCVDLVSNGLGGIYSGDGGQWLTLDTDAETPRLRFVDGEQPGLLWMFDEGSEDPAYFEGLCLGSSEEDGCEFGLPGWDEQSGTGLVVPVSGNEDERQGPRDGDSDGDDGEGFGLILMRTDNGAT
ncbi:hypothetical protein BDW74DRAFT_175597 [Aspergillus multicolor]|uniref:uncharacterized protein n=1 Tax=Aspergillus multicolor TaxID=41759 RepID=UPI003CCCDE8C